MYSLKSVAETEISLDADVKRGLSDVEAKARLEKYGENRLKEEKEKGKEKERKRTVTIIVSDGKYETQKTFTLTIKRYEPEVLL